MSENILDASGPQTLDLSETGVARLSSVLRADIERKRLPGAVALISRRGKIGYFEAHGLQNPGGPPMRPDSIFRVYSMTKPIVSVALMMLVEQGKLLLSDPLAKYIPEFAEPKVAVERDGKLTLHPAAGPILIQDLLRHTSGLTYDFVATGDLARLYVQAGLSDRSLTLSELCRRLAQLPLLHQPSTCWSYSRSTDVVGRVIEVVAGKSLGNFLSEFILRPLGMMDTGFYVPAGGQSRIAEPFATDPDIGTPVSLPNMRDVPALESGGGGLVSTAMDYARFCQMVASGGVLGRERLLGRKMIELMSSDHLGSGIAIDRALGLLPPGHRFGLGFAVRTDSGLAPFPGSVGTIHWGGIAGTTFWIDPREELFALLMIQAPGQREYYRTLFRNLVYAALV